MCEAVSRRTFNRSLYVEPNRGQTGNFRTIIAVAIVIVIVLPVPSGRAQGHCDGVCSRTHGRGRAQEVTEFSMFTCHLERLS